MTPDHKHPSATTWITVALVAVLVGYPLSWGPACCLDAHGWLTGPAKSVALWFYYPINGVYHNGPKPLADAVKWYGNLWA